jgi:hypothetical protein
VISPRKEDNHKLEVDMEINIVKFEEIKHLQERIKFAVITFEKTNSLFFDKPEIRMEEFMEK